MNIIYDDETLGTFRALGAIVEEVVARTKQQGLWDLTAIVLGEPDADLLGTDEPVWAWRTDHDGWVELGLPAANDGFAWIVLVQPDSSLAQQR